MEWRDSNRDPRHEAFDKEVIPIAGEGLSLGVEPNDCQDPAESFVLQLVVCGGHEGPFTRRRDSCSSP